MLNVFFLIQQMILQILQYTVYFLKIGKTSLSWENCDFLVNFILSCMFFKLMFLHLQVYLDKSLLQSMCMRSSACKGMYCMVSECVN